MTDFQQTFLEITKSALSGKKCPLPDDLSRKMIMATARRQKMENIIYYGLANCGFDTSGDDFKAFNNNVMRNIYVDQKQSFLLDLIVKEFTKNEICFCILKGPRLKRLYPKSDMREMVDIDVLIKVEQYDKIKPLLLNLGFTESEESLHELIWRYQNLIVEFHKQLIPSNNKDYFAFFGDGWDFVKPKTTGAFEYEMSKEDEFLFMFTHIAKHFRDTGIGIRYFVDLWLYKKAFSLDEAYLENNLETLNLLTFYRNFTDTSAVWFDGKKPTDLTDFITEYVFNSCVRGTATNSALSTGLLAKKYGKAVSGRKLTFFRLVFPDFRRMTVKYPVLKKVPVLLPFCYVARWFEALFFRRDTISAHKHELDLQTDQNIEKYEKDLKFMGIEYCFEDSENIKKR